MSQFAILIYEDPTFYETMPPDGWAAVVDAHNTFTNSSPRYQETPLSASCRVQPSACITGSNWAIEQGRSSTVMPMWSKRGTGTSYGRGCRRRGYAPSLDA